MSHDIARFVYLGPEGTFAEQALQAIIGRPDHGGVAAHTVAEALEAVRAETADAAVVPVESSVGGAVGVTLDELAVGVPLAIAKEIVLPVSFVLAARSGVTVDTVRTVAAHPQAAIQCRAWLRGHVREATVVEVLSNAAAAIAAAQAVNDAAICAKLGATRHGLTVLADDIGDNPDAMTRFLLVTRPGPPGAPTGDDVTSLVVWIAHDRVGALLAVLTELAVRGINLTRIESRPTGERLGRYAFFLDCTGHVAEMRMGEALQGLRRICADVRFLGSYPRAGHGDDSRTPLNAPPGTADADFAESAAWLSRLRGPRHLPRHPAL